MVVGSDPKEGRGRGVVAACNYEARRFGLHSAMPISRAWQRCPHAAFVRPRFLLYSAASKKIFSILERYTDLVEPISIDEAFLDVTASRTLFGDGPTIARAIKAEIRDEEALAASIGVAGSKFIAKLASDLEKPDGLVIVPPGEEREFLLASFQATIPLLIPSGYQMGVVDCAVWMMREELQNVDPLKKQTVNMAKADVMKTYMKRAAEGSFRWSLCLWVLMIHSTRCWRFSRDIVIPNCQ